MMSRVKLSEIPNAVQRGGEGGAGSLLQVGPEADQREPIDGVARVARGLAEAGKIPMKAAAALEHWQRTEREVRDFAGLNEITLRAQQADAALDEHMSAQPESQWETGWRELSRSTRDFASRVVLGPTAREQADRLLDRREMLARQRMVDRSRRELIAGARESAVARYEQLNDEDRYEEAALLMARARGHGLFTSEEEDRLHEQAIVRLNHRNVQRFIEADPWEARRVLEDEERVSGEPDAAERLAFRALTADDRANYREKARQVIAERQRSMNDELDAGIASGQMRDAAEVRARAASARLPDGVVHSLVRSLRDVPVDTAEQRANYLKFRSDFFSVLRGYDEAEDADGSRMRTIRDGIRRFLPMGERAGALEELRRAGQRTITPADLAQRDICEKIDRLAVLGFFHPGSLADEEADPADGAMRAYAYAGQLKSAFSAYAREHPQAEARQYKKWLADRVEDAVVRRAVEYWKIANGGGTEGVIER